MAEFDFDNDLTAYDFLKALLRDWGLEELAPAVLDLLQQGYSQDQVSFLIQDTEPYKERFRGNQLRKAAGLAALSPRDYLSVEGAYRQIMSSNGLPSGFYDSPSDFADWIGRDVSPQEIASRVGEAVDAADRLDEGTKRSFKDWYGVGPNDLAAFFLDQDRALPQIQRIARGVRVGGAAYREGLAMDRERAEQLGSLAGGRDINNLVAGTAEAFAGGSRLASIYGQSYTQADAEEEIFQGSEAKRRKREDLAGREKATFSGGSAVGRTTFSREKNY